MITIIKLGVEEQAGSYSSYHIGNGKLLYKGRVVIPKNSKIIPQLLQEYHDLATGGHNGELKTYLRVAMDWYWSGMRKQIAQHV